MNQTNRRWLALAGIGVGALVVAGQDLHGEAVVTNTTSKPIVVRECPENWLKVGLANAQIPFDPVVTMDMCSPPVQLAPGPNSFPITVQTIYQHCAPSGPTSISMPACVSNHIPALPAGTYQTEVDTQGLPSVTPAAPITVTVLAA